MSELIQYFQSQKQQMVDLLTTLVGFETPTTDKAMVDKMGAYMEAQFRDLGASSVTRYGLTAVGDCLLAKWNEDAPGKPIMFLIHIDTVWPLGTLAQRPVHIDEEGRLFGPGAIDMKGGITIVLSALRALKERGEMPQRPIWVLMTSDEEVGSVHSKAALMETAAQAGLVLVMEPATIDEELKTMRKGVSTYRVDITGLPSHAGNAPEKGINSIIEMAQQAMKIHSWNDLRNGTSVSVTMVNGGTATNVIPEHCSFHVDVRTVAVAAWKDIDAKLRSLPDAPFVPGAKLVVTQTNGHQPMERNATMQKTYAQCEAIGTKYGLVVTQGSSGGGSDGNTVAAMGIPVLDGLGPQGDGLHALHEHVVLNSLPRRATLMAAMLKEWQFD
jgi:glutamate carboxypeptidase